MARGCRTCQMHSNIARVFVVKLYSIVKPWTFRGWAIDAIGETSSQVYERILLCLGSHRLLHQMDRRNPYEISNLRRGH